MEYIEGAPLTEHFNSLKEKKSKFSEERIWNIFVQVGKSIKVARHYQQKTAQQICLGSPLKAVDKEITYIAEKFTV